MLKFLVFFLVFVLYSSVPIGFDLFHHVFTYEMGYEMSQRMNAGHEFFGINIPRYLLLSSIFNLSSLIGVPIFLCITLLVAAPLNSIIMEFISKRRITISDLLLLLFSLLFTIYFSGLSLSMLWFIAFFYTKKKVFAFGFFHPVSLLLTPLYCLINRSLIPRYLISFPLFLSVVYMLPFYPSTTIKQGITISPDLGDLMVLAEYAITAKGLEFSIISIFLVSFYFTRNLYVFSIGYKNAVIGLAVISASTIFMVAENSLKYFLVNGHPELMAYVYFGLIDENTYKFFLGLRGF